MNPAILIIIFWYLWFIIHLQRRRRRRRHREWVSDQKLRKDKGDTVG